jgi:hypothetical protein
MSEVILPKTHDLNPATCNFLICASETAVNCSANWTVCAARSLDHCGKFRKPDCRRVSLIARGKGAAQTGQFALRLPNH